MTTPLNPDARRAAFEAVQAIDGPASIGSMEIVDVAVSAYLEVAQQVVNSVKELDALPVGSIIVPLAYDEPTVLLRDPFGTWAVAGLPEPYNTKKIHRALRGKGARIVYMPEVKP